MSRFTIHGIAGSPYLRTAMLALEEKGADYRFAAMAPGDHQKAPHLKLHPFGKIPVLIDGDFVLYETQAILRYIDRELPASPLFPEAPRAEARTIQVIGIVDSYFREQVTGAISFQRVFAPRFGIPVDEAVIAAALPEARLGLAELGRLLGRQGYFGGDRVSAADLMVAPHLAYLRDFAEGQSLLADQPALVEWLERMDERPSMARTQADRIEELATA